MTVKKQILRFGSWVHPKDSNKVLDITKEYATKLVDNFKKSPFAPILRGHAKRKDAEENPSLIINKNITSLEIDEDGVNAVMDVDKKEIKKYNDVSCGIDPRGKDTKTGRMVGPVLKHIALTLDPYIKNLNPFVALEDANEEDILINLSDIKDMKSEKKTDVELADESNEEAKVEKVEKIEETEEVETEEEEVKDTEVKEAEEKPEVESKDSDEKSEEPKEEPAEAEESKDIPEDEAKEEETPEAKDESEDNLSESQRKRIMALEEELMEKNRLIACSTAEASYDKLLRVGKVTPAQKDAFIALSQASGTMVELSDGEKSVGDLITELYDKAPAIVKLEEQGVDTEASEEDDKLKSELRERHKGKTDKEFEKWYEKNRETIKSAIKK